ncbi:cell division protein SepF [Gordonia araii NBRC 100433]|uniref:Cell division protein SepF n=1 Tax=Gordonia araii NBRC 100433 TaxID=1073574 RepID=G7H2T5_9ACTN|nr:cell division protein SepF [Gordonia araii]NNG98514.1 cell division protein SepF [Gordonia araii NBRC 100433]GAB10160.1 cell division protein SepF [Gordonia araii NBRC 100433]
MTTMQKFKAYFGMVPPSDYEDDYLEDEGTGAMRRVRGRGGDPRSNGYDDDYYGQTSYRDGAYADPYASDTYGADPYGPDSYGGRFGAEDDLRRERVRSSSRYEEDEREFAAVGNGGYVYTGAPRPEPRGARLEPLQRSAGATLRAVGAAAVGQDEPGVFGDGQKITTLRPSSYSEARTIGERFRNGNPVIMDLVDMSNADAKRLVDFAAGLAFALRGSFDKVATKVFLLAPADIDVSPEDRRRIAETGFYSHS